MSLGLFSITWRSRTKKVLAIFLVTFLLFLAFSFSYIKSGSGATSPKYQEYQAIKEDLERANQDYLVSASSEKATKLNSLVAKAVTRKNKLKKDLEENPSLFIQNAALINSRQSYPAEVKAHLEESVEAQGNYYLVHFDNQNKQPKYDNVLDTSGGIIRSEKQNSTRWKLRFADNPKIESGSKVKIKGIRLDNQIALYGENNQNTTNLEVLSVPGDQYVSNANVAVILLKFTDTVTEPFTATDVSQNVFGGTTSTEKYHEENSINQLAFSGDVHGWYSVDFNSTDGCNYFGWAGAADQAAINEGVDLSSYSQKFYVFPQAPGCPGIAWAYINGTQSWANGSIDSRIFGHELGHNFGAHHANTLSCGTKSIDAPQNCVSEEYGDWYDVMGNFWYAEGNSYHFNAAHKASVGWIPTSKIQTVSTDGTYQVYSGETTQTGPQILKIRRNDTGEYYYISFRENVGFDTNLPQAISTGANIHLWTEDNLSQTFLLDMTPGSASGFSDSALLDGQEFYDQINLISVKQLSHSVNSSTLQIKFNAIPTPTPTPVEIELLKNPGFETDSNADNKPDSWSSNSNFTITTTSVHSGTFSGKHRSTANAGYNVKQVVKNLTAGRTYNFSGWANIPAQTDPTFNLIIQIKWRNSLNKVISTTTVKNYSSSTSGWNQAIKTVTAPTGATNAVVNMQIKSLNGTIYVDDFSLKDQ